MFGGVSHLALLLTEYSVGLNVNSRVPAPSAACNFARTIFDMCSPFQARNPLWASSSVSVATWLAPISSDGPVHFTGKTPSRFQVAIALPSESSAEISAVCRLTSILIFAIQLATLLVSLLMGRVSLTF